MRTILAIRAMGSTYHVEANGVIPPHRTRGNTVKDLVKEIKDCHEDKEIFTISSNYYSIKLADRPKGGKDFNLKELILYPFKTDGMCILEEKEEGDLI